MWFKNPVSLYSRINEYRRWTETTLNLSIPSRYLILIASITYPGSFIFTNERYKWKRKRYFQGIPYYFNNEMQNHIMYYITLLEAKWNAAENFSFFLWFIFHLKHFLIIIRLVCILRAVYICDNKGILPNGFWLACVLWNFDLWFDLHGREIILKIQRVWKKEYK